MRGIEVETLASPGFKVGDTFTFAWWPGEFFLAPGGTIIPKPPKQEQITAVLQDLVARYEAEHGRI